MKINSTTKSIQRAIKQSVMATSLMTITMGVAIAHNNPGYSHDDHIGYSNPNWMASIQNGALLSQISIPGTHDSGAYNFGGDAVETQTMSLSTQLNSGIRAWDIRLGSCMLEVPYSLCVYHGAAPQGIGFDSVLRDAANFLTANPTETVLMRIKHEIGTKTMFEYFLNEDLNRVDHLLYKGQSDNPTMGEMRGKIVILQDYEGADKGIPWGSFNIQDNFHLTTNWDLYSKWESVKGHLSKSSSGATATKYINFLSGSGGSFPYFVASGHSSPATGASRLSTGKTIGVFPNDYPDFPRVACAFNPFIWGEDCTIAFEGTNTLTMDKIKSGPVNRAGIVYADFPGGGLIDSVIGLNYSLSSNIARINGVNFLWSSSGAIPFMHCTAITEASDPHTWQDNYFCSSKDIGMRWSSAGPIADMKCTQILEPADPHTWNDNYLCLPASSQFGFQWSYSGSDNVNAVQWIEASDPHTWLDNYLTVTHGDTLGQGFYLEVNEQLVSSDGRHRLVMQGDGNLVIYSNDQPIWATNTHGSTAVRAYLTNVMFNTGGNLMLLDAEDQMVWKTNSLGTNTRLIMQNDGNLVIYSDDNTPIWSSNTCCR
ncbi:phosphatidylinositol-specific phospholipase C domain-containing protein [Pseudoalteromonas sp. T1lg23B]|uniref:phosphatidylinositol-specific phospholipase C domain-containing protein n=1 Tax=Pseudoalteromonas sp. T1lg23B TaxID=2077097 RepID=UPI000CF63009|nr:phosphatidylinositol-specific phospholipase C domain-containing protein [Pseudoalteromonas sp. T1lg23B]